MKNLPTIYILVKMYWISEESILQDTLQEPHLPCICTEFYLDILDHPHLKSSTYVGERELTIWHCIHPFPLVSLCDYKKIFLMTDQQ